MLILQTCKLMKGLFVTWHVIFDAANATSFQGKLPDLTLISTLFDIFIKPHFKTWGSERIPKALEDVERTVERVVRLKIKQLQPFLQDDIDEQETDNEITFEGNDETTIVEFVPHIDGKYKTDLTNDTFKTNMKRYKKVRNKIYKALEAEMVTDKTKTLVMRTMDELLSKMVETQCQWKRGEESTSDNVNRLIIPRTIVNMWREEWQKFKAKLTQQQAKSPDNTIDNLMSYLTKLNSIINDVSINLESFAKKYRVRCNVSERKNFNKRKSMNSKNESYRLSYASDSEKICNNFKVCSKELKAFFIEFYKSVNATAVNVLRSYAEMFTRDVNTDVSNEKNSIVDIILKLADRTEKDFVKIFVNYTTQFHLDQTREKEANMNLLLEYIKNVTTQVNETVSKKIINKLDHIHKKVSASIYQDIVVNLGVDLDNLERHLTNKICLIFNVCNGNLKNRRHGNGLPKSNSIDENKIYVKVELTIDKEPDLVETGLNIDKPRSTKTSDMYGKSLKMSSTLNYRKYANISVTRTTLSNKAS